MMPVEYVRRQLELKCTALGSQKRFSQKHHVSLPYVNDVLNGRREPGEKILKALKMKRVTGYVHASLLLATILVTLPTWSYAVNCDREAGYDDERSFHARSFGEWCRAEAQRVKEGA